MIAPGKLRGADGALKSGPKVGKAATTEPVAHDDKENSKNGRVQDVASETSPVSRNLIAHDEMAAGAAPPGVADQAMGAEERQRQAEEAKEALGELQEELCSVLASNDCNKNKGIIADQAAAEKMTALRAENAALVQELKNAQAVKSELTVRLEALAGQAEQLGNALEEERDTTATLRAEKDMLEKSRSEAIAEVERIRVESARSLEEQGLEVHPIIDSVDLVIVRLGL